METIKVQNTDTLYFEGEINLFPYTKKGFIKDRNQKELSIPFDHVNNGAPDEGYVMLGYLVNDNGTRLELNKYKKEGAVIKAFKKALGEGFDRFYPMG